MMQSDGRMYGHRQGGAALAAVVVGLFGVGRPAAAVVFANFEDGKTDGFGTLTSSGVTSFVSPVSGSVITPASGGNATQVLDVTASGYNGGLSGGTDIGYDFVANGQLANFMANDVLTFNWQVAPSSTTTGYSQLYQIVLNGPGAGYQGVGGSSGQTNSLLVSSGTFNQYPNYAGQVNTVTINYDAFKAMLSASPGYLQLGIVTNNGGGAPADLYFDDFALSTIGAPEPTSTALVGLAMAGLGGRRRRRG